MRASRLLALLLVLQRRRNATAAQLALEMEVSLRTLYRDIAALLAAGVPILTSAGPGGGVRLQEGWRTKLDGFTAGETDALALAGAPKVAADLGLATLVASARAKLDATLPEALRGRARQLRERFLLDAPGWFARVEPLGALAAVADATWAGRKLDLRYGKRRTRRRVDPLGLVLKAGTWYLVARHRGQPRTYRVSRIEEARVRDDAFERPPAFNLAAYWADASAAFGDALLKYPCRLRLSAHALVVLPRVAPNESVARQLGRAKATGHKGWVEVALRLESEDVAVGQLMAVGSGVEVLAPRALRRRLAAVGREIARRNR